MARELMNSCQTLREYAILIDTIRKYQKIYSSLEDAVNMAVNECIENDVLAEFLLEDKSEVVDMLLTEYNEEETMEMLKQEAKEEGEIYILIKQICKKIQKGKSLEVISDELEEEVENILPIYEAVKQCAPEYDYDRIYDMLNKA